MGAWGKYLGSHYNMCDTQNVFQPQGTVNYCCSKITDWKPLM